MAKRTIAVAKRTSVRTKDQEKSIAEDHGLADSLNLWGDALLWHLTKLLALERRRNSRNGKLAVS